MWSERDYGNRVGVFRLMDTLNRYGMRGTVALNSNLCAEHPQIIAEGNKRGWEWMGHNESNTRRLNEAAPGEEAGIIRRTLDTIGKAAGQRPTGWLSPACSRPGTRSICWRPKASNTRATGATTTSPM